MFDPTDEQVFKFGPHELRYMVRGPRSGSRMVAVFSGFEAGHAPRYNYIRQLEGVAAPRMYLLDDLGPRGCYYLGADRELFVADAVEEAIRIELARYGLEPRHLITVGSSKGGSAALYFGLRLGCHVIAGAPQYKIGTYCVREAAAVAVAELIAGGSGGDDVEWLDDVLPVAVAAAHRDSKIEIYSSLADEHHDSHVRPLLADLERAGVEHRLTLGTYAGHRNVFKQYGPWMRGRVNRLTDGPGRGFVRRAVGGLRRVASTGRQSVGLG